MKTQLLLPALAACVLAGCQSGANQTQALLERELRLQEDKIYHLQAIIEDKEMMLDSSRRENEALKHELGTGDRVPAVDSLPSPPNVSPPAAPPPRSLPPRAPSTPRSIVPPRSRNLPAAPPATIPAPPMIEGVPSLESALPTLPSESALPSVPGAPGELPSPPTRSLDRGVSNSPSTDKVTKIVLNPRLTGGLDHDGRPGDEGILVSLEPRDAAGKLVNSPGDISVVVLDPAKQGPAARVARWDFKSDEVALHFRNSALEKGLHFELPWPSEPPTSARLQLFVRYSTPLGEKLVVDQTIQVHPPSPGPANKWTRAAAPRTAAVAPPASMTPSASAPVSTSPVTVVRDAPQVTVGENGEEPAAREPVARQAALPMRERTGSTRPTWSPYR